MGIVWRVTHPVPAWKLGQSGLAHSGFPIRPPMVQGQKGLQASRQAHTFANCLQSVPKARGCPSTKETELQTYPFYFPCWASPVSQEKLLDSFFRELQIHRNNSAFPFHDKRNTFMEEIIYSGLLMQITQKARKNWKSSFTNRTLKMYWRGRWEGGSGWGIHVNPWLIHVNVWQNPLQYCKVISLQLIKKIKLNLKKEKINK